MGCFERSTIYKPRVCPFYSFENRKSWVCGGCQRRQRCWYVQIFLFPGLFLSFRVDQEKPRGLLKNMFSKKPKKSTEAFLRISAKSITSVDRDASGYLPCGFLCPRGLAQPIAHFRAILAKTINSNLKIDTVLNGAESARGKRRDHTVHAEDVHQVVPHCDIVLSTFLSLIDEEEGRRSLALINEKLSQRRAMTEDTFVATLLKFFSIRKAKQSGDEGRARWRGGKIVRKSLTEELAFAGVEDLCKSPPSMRPFNVRETSFYVFRS
uniref:Uncharacterized protein n=1 Tax=Palpitomonas bilix TaxID=652834 RepID=A0A7S3D6I6_9EUKA|mmetsp:Transcript_24401/g.61745  ORF Transcript_24401/g.61745 Transcript_24401/m.61745 type:complete len:266 (+) Transcript_24401:1093-1890(+)